MKTKKLIKVLRNDPQFVDTEIMTEAANRLEMLSVELKKTHAKLVATREELKEERYRHDRYVDFELYEAQELARVKAERDAAIKELHRLSVCATCTGNGTKCHVDMPVPDNPTCCGSYEWRGETDTNVGGKKEDAKC